MPFDDDRPIEARGFRGSPDDEATLVGMGAVLDRRGLHSGVAVPACRTLDEELLLDVAVTR